MVPQRLPHLLLFNPDQWRGDAVGYAGDPAAQTPRLDRLVREEGVAFNRSYCQNPVCTPSRCSFMTGWYPHVRGHRTMRHMLHGDRGEPNLLAHLRKAGYFVWWGGKNDLLPGQDPAAFEEGCDVYFQPTEADYARWGHPSRSRARPDLRGEPGSDTFFSFFAGRYDTEGDEIYCDSDWANILGAIDFIRAYDGEQPLCVYLPLEFPHVDYGVEDPWFSNIDRSALPERVAELDPHKPALLHDLKKEQGLEGWTEDRWTELRAAYYGMISRVDHQFGRVLDALRERDFYDDTAAFLFSDHGDYTGDYGIVEKTQNTFEDCLTRVPFAMKPPKEVPVQPRVTDALVELVDLSETIYDLCGIEPGYTRFGRSLLPLLAGETDAHRGAVFCEGGRLQGELSGAEIDRKTRDDWAKGENKSPYWPRIQSSPLDEPVVFHGKATMCRTERHKYIRRLCEPDEFYDLEKDPRETTNLIDDPNYQAIITELRLRLLTWYQETCDVVPAERDARRR